LVNISNKHLIKHTVLLIYGGLWSAPERRGDKLVVGETVSFHAGRRRAGSDDVGTDMLGNINRFYYCFYLKQS
jgi:hypothetical protein